MYNDEDNGCLTIVVIVLLIIFFVFGSKLDDIRERLARIEKTSYQEKR